MSQIKRIHVLLFLPRPERQRTSEAISRIYTNSICDNLMQGIVHKINLICPNKKLFVIISEIYGDKK